MVIEISTDSTIINPIISGLSGVLGAAIGAFTTGFIIRSEATRKIRLESIIEIINGIGEFKSAVNELDVDVVNIAGEFFLATEGRKIKKLNKLEDIADEIINAQSVGSRLDQGEIAVQLSLTFREVINNYNREIGKFIFFLEKDMIVNENDNAVKKEIKIIKGAYKKVKDIFDYKAPSSIKGLNLIAEKIWDEAGKRDSKNKINKSIKRILKIYKAKLDEENKSWVGKLLNWFCKLFNYFINCFCKLFNYFINCFCECCECLNSENKKKPSAKKQGRKKLN